MTKKYLRESIKLGTQELIVETGKVAKQADGSVIIRYGDTMLLVAAVSARTAKEGLDFFPLTVEYRENTFSAGRIPGNYFRREGRPSEKEVLTCRLIDRPVRPLFADGYRFETQIVASVISADSDNDPDVVAITGASCALYLSDIPFENPIAGVRIGLIDGKYPVTGGGTIFGNLGRNALRGPGQRNVDMALIKRIRVGEKTSLVFRWEVFNVFNWPNFANPASDVSSPSTFGRISAMSVNPRIMQFGLKLEF